MRQQPPGLVPRMRRAAGLALLIGSPFAAAAAAAAVEEAIAVVDQLQSALVEAAAIKAAVDSGGHRTALAPVVSETHDLPTMSRLTVRRFWNAWNEADRARFVAAFERLSIATYASRFAAIGPDSFEILGARAIDDRRVEVNAIIRRQDADDVPMDYTLQDFDDQWRIVNIIADGVSELSLMASEYYEILESGSLDDLIMTIDQEVAALN